MKLCSFPWRNASKILGTCKFSSCVKKNKKDLCYPIQPAATVEDVESGWYDWWEENNFFKKENAEKNFVMMLPPPNITGKLHMGHAVTCALQDSLARWNNMSGKNVLWIPGCDHAGIATQVVVERHLWETKKLTRHCLGKENFLKEILKWKEEKCQEIYQQMKRLGVTLNWDRSYFTLDERSSIAVVEAFTRLFEEGLIYRGNYMVSWCCALRSAISDLEVESLEIDGPTKVPVPGYEQPVTFGYLYTIKYRVADSDEMIAVSTTRPETVLGDTGLAVHPEDPRYAHLSGKFAIHPFSGERIPIVTDTSVQKEFGTGVVKITPGHSTQDYQIAQKHNLPTIEIYDDTGCVGEFGEFKGLPRFKARNLILNSLASKGLYDGVKEPHSMRLPRCMRTGDIIEHRLKVQWFLATNLLTEDAINTVKENDLRLHPPELHKIWDHFLSSGREWCLSRQLWWGHRIPVFWVSTTENSVFGSEEEINQSRAIFVAAKSEQEAKSKAAATLGIEESYIRFVKQEEDVLDTWFSSSILPFSIFGWPDTTVELQKYFPLSLMETGHDILFFWVARMVMMSQKLMGGLPFKDVLLHGLVCDSAGQKMSKSKGNVIDPMDVIEGATKLDHEGKFVQSTAFGADALRFALCSLPIKKRNLPLDFRSIDQERLFRNKMWQTIRFLMQNIQNIPDGEQFMKEQRNGVSHVMDQWMMSRLSRLVTEVDEGFNSYDLNEAATAFKDFWYYTLCDVYLEVIKPRLWNFDSSMETYQECLKVLWTCCHTGLIALAPFMPFLAEELYQRLPSVQCKLDSVHQCSYPKPEEWQMFRNVKLEEEVDSVLMASSALRTLRKTYNITSKSAQGKASICIEDESLRRTASEVIPEITRISFIEELSVLSPNDYDPTSLAAGVAVQPVRPGVSVHLYLQGMIDPHAESLRLLKKLQKLEKKREKVLTRIERMRSLDKESSESDVLMEKQWADEIDQLNSILETVSRMKENSDAS